MMKLLTADRSAGCRTHRLLARNVANREGNSGSEDSASRGQVRQQRPRILLSRHVTNKWRTINEIAKWSASLFCLGSEFIECFHACYAIDITIPFKIAKSAPHFG